MPGQEVSVALRLRGARTFQSEARGASRALAGIGTSANTLSRRTRTSTSQMSTFGKATSKARGYLRGFGSSLLGLGAGFLAFRGIQSSIDSVETLGEGTLRLHRAMKLSTPTASRWMAVLMSRGADPRSLTMSYKALANQIGQAEHGSKKAIYMFERLHINWRNLRHMDPTKQIETVSDALNHVGPAADRARLGGTLFGRGWASLAPILGGGSKLIQQQLKLADKYGVTLHGKTVKSLEELLQAQRENQMAMLGLSIQVGQKLIPWVLKGINAFNRFAVQMRTGKGAGGEFIAVMRAMGTIARGMAKYIGGLIHAFRVFWGALGHVGITGRHVMTVIKTIYTVLGGVPIILYRTRHVWIAVGHAVERIAKSIWHALDKYLIRPIKWIINHVKKIGDIPSMIGHGVTGAAGGAVHSVTSAVGSAAHYANPFNWQEGGLVRHGGIASVGERGPEIVTLPTGSHVGSNRDVVGAIRALARQPIVVQTTLDGRVLTTAVANRVAYEKARR